MTPVLAALRDSTSTRQQVNVKKKVKLNPLLPINTTAPELIVFWSPASTQISQI